jgi:hypothetical protein
MADLANYLMTVQERKTFMDCVFHITFNTLVRDYVDKIPVYIDLLHVNNSPTAAYNFLYKTTSS